jgi:hypothetical protein
MPKAVAILEGDSSSLVKSINDAKGAMQKLEGEGRKLTDQLRDVADEADKAAGNLVNKIGGGTAIKAIAGVTAGFAAAQTALGAFSGSMQAFYSTQGEAGAKAMEDIDMALNKMSSQLFTAVMGTDNLEEATQTLLTVINFLADALNLVLWPIEQVTKFLRMMSELGDQGATAAEKHAKELTKFAGVQDTVKVSYDNVAEAIAKNKLNVMGLTGATEDLAKAQIRQQMAVVNSLADSAKAAEKTREEAEIGLEVLNKKAENMARATETAVGAKLVPGSEEFVSTVNSVYAGLTLATLNTARAAREGWSKETKQLLADAGADYQALQLLLFAVGQTAEKTSTQVNNVRTGRNAPAAGAGDGKAPELSPWEKQKQEMDAYYAEAAKKQQESNAKAYADGIAAVVAQTRAEEAAKAAEEKAAKDKKLADEQADYDARKAMALDLFQVKAKLLVQEMAIGKNGFKVMADMARKAIGDAISAKGDEAMAQAAIYAAAFNPQAIPMAAAGVAAYAAAAMLGSSAKKSASSTPAAAAPIQAAPVNTSFNLRVDAAFADGESIARQFAMMQRNAQSRGLIPAGA